MAVSVRAIRADYRFADPQSGIAASENLKDLFRASKTLLRSSDAETKAVEVQLSGRRTSGADADAEGVGTSKSPGAVTALFSAFKELGDRLRAIQAELDGEAPGSNRRVALEKELEAQRKEYDSLISSDTFKRLQELFGKIDQALARGVSRSDLARLLKGARGLLGDEFLGTLQQGDVGGLAGLRSGLTALQAVDLTAPTAGLVLGKIGEDALRVLAGRRYQDEEVAPVTSVTADSAIPPPILQRTVIDIPGNVSFALNSVTGKDIARAIESHALPDPRYALVLILDKGDTETPEEEKKRIEEQRRQREEAQSSPFVRT